MINESFIFLPGVQARTEQRLWEAGITSWDELLLANAISGISRERLSFWKTRIRHCQALLEQESLHHLARMLGRNSWRLYHYLMSNPRFVDIETTEYRNDITVIGVSDGEFYQAFVKGRNLDAQSLRHAFAGASCIITFNGSSFDLPIIERRFPGVLPTVPHLDLRHICRQAGLCGGLKAIEQQLSISRMAAIKEYDGVDAIMLWYRYLLGDDKALQELIDYNAADVLNLGPLAQKVIPRLWKHLRYGEELPYLPQL